MKRLYIYCLAATAAASVASTACKDDTDECRTVLEIAYSGEEALPYSGATARIAVETDASWTADRAQGDDWYTLTPASGSGSASIEVRVDANTGDDARRGTITVSAGSLQQSVEIRQLGRSSAPPAAAGAIEGREAGARGETITLTVAPIEGATLYRWYRDGAEIQTDDARTLNIATGGVYKVAGVNISGEGAASPDKTVTYDDTKFVFSAAEATYEGGDYNYEYHVRLSSPTGPDSEVGLRLIFCEQKPESVADPATTSIVLPARSYVVSEPLYNNWSAVGVVLPCTAYSLEKSYFYAIEEGRYVGSEYKYLCQTGGFEALKDQWTYDFAPVEVAYDPAAGIYEISGSVPCFAMNDNAETPVGYYEFSYEGPLSFKNNWREYNTYYFTEDDLDEDLDLNGLITQSSTLRYGGNISGEGHYWHLELWQNPMEQPGWDIIMDFYTPAEAADAAPYGTYTIAETPRAGVPMTADRGYYLKPEYQGLKCQRWNPQGGISGAGAYDIHVLGQPDGRSYIKLSDNGSGGYEVEVVMFDSKGHKISARYNGTIAIEKGTSGKTRFTPGIPYWSDLRE